MLLARTGFLEKAGRGGNEMASAFSVAAAVTGVIGIAVPAIKFGVDLIFRLF